MSLTFSFCSHSGDEFDNVWLPDDGGGDEDDWGSTMSIFQSPILFCVILSPCLLSLLYFCLISFLPHIIISFLHKVPWNFYLATLSIFWWWICWRGILVLRLNDQGNCQICCLHSRLSLASNFIHCRDVKCYLPESYVHMYGGCLSCSCLPIVHFPIWQCVFSSIMDISQEYTGESGRTFDKRLEEYLRAPYPIHEHGQSPGHCINMDSFSLVGKEAHGITSTIKKAMFISVSDPSLKMKPG